jgi:hypothetical protein
MLLIVVNLNMEQAAKSGRVWPVQSAHAKRNLPKVSGGGVNHSDQDQLLHRTGPRLFVNVLQEAFGAACNIVNCAMHVLERAHP